MIRTLFFVSVASVILIGCGSSEEKSKPLVIADSTSLNPNGDSELARLMREMADFMDKTREKISKGDTVLLPYPDHFVQIHTAQCTPGMVDEQTMRVMGSSFLQALQMIYDAPADLKKVNYNIAVNTCTSCHESVCPGPLKRIHKMTIP